VWQAPLPRRDWIVLPILSLLTVVAMAVVTETIARQFFSASQTSLNSCLILNDASTGVRGIPNAICLEKYPETQLVEYKFDCSGYRTGMECRPKPPGVYRIAMIGSSIAMGERVAIDKSLAALLPKELSQLTGRAVDLYNYAMAFGFPRSTVLRFNDVLAAKPDLILWVLTSVDVKLADFEYGEYSHNPTPLPASSPLNAIKTKVKDKVGNPVAASQAALLHFLQKYQGQDQYIQSYLTIPEGAEGEWDAGPGALSATLTPVWDKRLKQFDGYAADIARMTSAAGVPLVAVMVPNRAQAAMISLGHWPKHFDPFKLNRELCSQITNHGGICIHILPAFHSIPNAERYYYPIDGHPDADGHALIAGYIARELTAGEIPELRATVRREHSFGHAR
jgi:hypothetical protein